MAQRPDGASAVCSLTGVGLARGSTEFGDVSVEVRSVNARGLAIKTRLPSAWQGLEAYLEMRARGSVRRGTVTITLELHGARDDASFDEVRAERAIAQLRALAARLGIGGELRIADLLAIPGIGNGAASPPRTSWQPPPALAAQIEAAFTGMIADRRREGAATVRSVGDALDQLDAARRAAAARVPQVIELHRARLLQRVNEFLDGRARPLQDADVVKEVALFADRADVAEELQRLGEHLTAARTLLAQGGEVGRRLEFTAQEMLREANTLGSKSPDSEMARAAVAMKAEIERIKEQAANLE